MIGFDEASAILARVPERTAIERVPLAAAAGRTLAEPVVARIDSPRRDVSAMDGYAVRDLDLATLPATLPVAGEHFAGSPDPAPLAPGGCARVFTGAPLAPGTDRVVMQEDVERNGETARFAGPLSSSRHVRRRASDFAAGEPLLAAGTRLLPSTLVAAGSADVAEVAVHARPRVIVLGTGDELAAPGEASARPGAIPDTVALAVAALVGAWGGEGIGQRRVPDDLAALERAAAEAVSAADLVVVTGGASVGEKDFARTMFAPLGLELLFSKVAIKPGKPVWLGRAGGRLVLGLPGNPGSAMVTARLFLAPLLLRLAGGEPRDALDWRPLALAAPLPAGGTREEFVRARWTGSAALPLTDQRSGSQRPLASADLLLRRPAGAAPVAAGDPVPALALD